jgi:hypothetical protein
MDEGTGRDFRTKHRRGTENSQVKGPAPDRLWRAQCTKEAIPSGRIFQVNKQREGTFFLPLFIKKENTIYGTENTTL